MPQTWNGWKGTILKVDLSKKEITRQKLTPELAKAYIGGRGFAIRILYDECPAKADPLGPENPVIFATGPLNGTPLGSGGRLCVYSKGLTGQVSDGNLGGFFASELKFAGYDAIVVTGKSEKPVYIWVDDDNVEIRDASHMWGKTIRETDRILREEIGDTAIECLYIGPAGENLVNMPVVLSGVYHSARGGTASVMGSKKLKAVAVRGSGTISVASPHEFENELRQMWDHFNIEKSPHGRTKEMGYYSTNALMRFSFTHLAGPGPNLMDETCRVGAQLSAEELLDKYTTKPKAGCCCYFPSCGHWNEVAEGKYAGTHMESVFIGLPNELGCLTNVGDWPTIIKGGDLCNNLGVDWHVGAAISWAMEAYERGVLTKRDTDGVELRFGNGEAMLELIRKVAYREGFGDILAHGIKWAAEKFGKGSERYAMHVKGLEISGVNYLRSNYLAALGQACNDMGSDHSRFHPPMGPDYRLLPPEFVKTLPFDVAKSSQPYEPDDKGHLLKYKYDHVAVIDSLPFCVFLTFASAILMADKEPFARALTATTGEKFTASDLDLIGERICNLERAFVAREGKTRKDDALPPRYLEEPVQWEDGQGSVVPLEIMKDDYYKARGWDLETGLPTAETLQRLRLKEVANDLKNLGMGVN